MEKNLKALVFSALIFLTFSTFQKTYGMDYAFSFFATENSIKQTIVSGLASQILPPIQSGDTINTKSQKPTRDRNQGYYTASIEGKPIREGHKDNQEKLIRKIMPGEDGRSQVLQTDEWPYSVHGMVYVAFRNGDSGWGSGTLIAPNLVLTAAHNLYNTKLYKGAPIGRVTEVEFYPAKNGMKAPFGKQTIKDFYYPKQYTKDESEDYGLLVLENPIGEEAGYFGISILNPDQVKTLNINVTGYPGDKVEGKNKIHEMWGMEGKATSVDQGIIEYEIDTYPGQSGSGVWYCTPTMKQVISYWFLKQMFPLDVIKKRVLFHYWSNNVEENYNYFVIGVHVAGDHIRPVNKATLLTKSRYKQIRTWINDSARKSTIANITGGMFSTVERVDLNSKYIGNFGVNALCEFAKNLHTVNLSANSIDDGGCRVLAEHPTITDLNLHNNNITNEGATELAKSSRLLSLDVSWNYIGYDGAMALAQRQSLISLNLSNNRIEKAKEVLLSLANTYLKRLGFSRPYCKLSPTKKTLLLGGLAVGGGVLAGGTVLVAAIGEAVAPICTIVGGGVMSPSLMAGGTITGGHVLGATGLGGGTGTGVFKLIDGGEFEMGREEAAALSTNTALTELDLSNTYVTYEIKSILLSNTTLKSLIF